MEVAAYLIAPGKSVAKFPNGMCSIAPTPHEVELVLLEEPLPGPGLVAGQLHVLEIIELSIRGNATL